MDSFDGWYLRTYPRQIRHRHSHLPRTRHALEVHINNLADKEKNGGDQRSISFNGRSGAGRGAQRRPLKGDQSDILLSKEDDSAALPSSEILTSTPPARKTLKAVKLDRIVLDESDPMQSLIARAMKAAARATAAADTARKLVAGKATTTAHKAWENLPLPKKDLLPVRRVSIAEELGLDNESLSSNTIETVTATLVNEKSQKKSISASKIDELCSTMRAHTSSAAVQHWASLLLYDFVWDDQGRARLADAGGIDLLVNAMSMHSNDAPVQSHICSAMANLAISDDVRARFLLAGGLPRLFAAMRNHEDDPDVISPAFRTLLSLSWNPAVRRKVRAQGGLEAAVEYMAKYEKHAEVQEWGARLLGVFAIDEADRTQLGSAGGVERLMSSVATLPPGGPLAGRSAAAWAVVASALHERGNQMRVLMAPPAQLEALAAALSPRRHEHPAPKTIAQAVVTVAVTSSS